MHMLAAYQMFRASVVSIFDTVYKISLRYNWAEFRMVERDTVRGSILTYYGGDRMFAFFHVKPTDSFWRD